MIPFFRVGRWFLDTCSFKTKQFFYTYTFRTKFSKTLHTLLRTEARVKSKFPTKTFSNPQAQRKQLLKTIEQVPKSPWITTDRKGANTFPFYNLPPEPEKHLEKRKFSMLFFLSLLDKIKVGGDSCLPRHFAKTNAKRKPAFQKAVSSFPPYHRL